MEKLKEALKIYQDKICELEKERGKTANRAEKFSLEKEIEECYQQIKRIKTTLKPVANYKDIDEINLLVAKLNIAKLKGKEGDRITGSFYSYCVCLEDVLLENLQIYNENKPSIQKYKIQGKWKSTVYKEINVFGLRVDYPWGKNKKPYGNFTITIEILKETISQIKIDVERCDNSPNNYAADKVKQLIQRTINQTTKE